MIRREGKAPLSIARDDPAFDGHFPGAPMLPGARLLDRAIQGLIDARALSSAVELTVHQVKFLSPAGPGARLELRWREGSGGRLAIELRSDDGARVMAATIS